MARKGGFKGFGGNAGMGNMMKQVQQMQKKMEQAQKEIEESEVTGTAGGGMVEVKVNGKKQLLEVNLKPEVVDPEDIEMLQDLILTAVNDAISKVEELGEEKMGSVTNGVSIPGLF